MDESIFKSLNKEQIQAVKHYQGPSIILAGAGSGKTRVLTSKVLNLIKNHNVPPTQILMVTFTNKAAAEMKSRVDMKLGFMGTFHSLGVRILRSHAFAAGLDPNFVIYDSNDQEDVIKEVLKKLDMGRKYTPSFLLNKISAAKDQLISPEKYKELFTDYTSDIVGNVYKKYHAYLERNNAVDFDDLLYRTVNLFIEHPEILDEYQEKYKYVLVDEFQDTNFAQYYLTRLLGKKYQNVTIVGDFCQSIYSWRGAEIKNLEKFEKDFDNVQIFNLTQNYRSTQRILNFAYDVISKNQTHPILELFTDNKQGEDVVINELENEQYEALFVAQEVKRLIQNGYSYNDIAVLYRINAQSRTIEEALLNYSIPYTLVGGTRFYERKEIKDILSYVRLIVNPLDEISLKRVLKIGKLRYDGFKKAYQELKERSTELTTSEIIDEILQKTRYIDLYHENDPEDLARLENIKELRSVAINFAKINDFLEQIALVESEYSENEKMKKGEKGLTLMTLHQAKGLEFKSVFLVGIEDGILPHSRSVEDLYQLEEERRLFYVGITRAREKLYLTHTRKRFMFGRRMYSQISRFISSEGETDDYTKTW
jgi:DNA helicase-2/ATP-dependent DNA helicase PcrA